MTDFVRKEVQVAARAPVHFNKSLYLRIKSEVNIKQEPETY